MNLKSNLSVIGDVSSTNKTILLKVSFLFAALFLYAGFSFAQNFAVKGGVQNNKGTAESGVTVTAIADGSTVATTKTSTSGRFELEIPYGKTCTIEFSKAGYAKRFFIVDLNGVKEQNMSMGEDVVSMNVKILPNIPGADMSSLSSTPITTFTFDKRAGIMTKDSRQEAASDKLESELSQKVEQSGASSGPNLEALNKTLKSKIKVGDDAMAKEDYAAAQKAYLDAVDFAGKNSLDDAEAMEKLDKADEADRQKKEKDLLEKQANEAFFAKLEEAKKLEAKEEFEKALEKLNQAKELKSDHPDLAALETKINAGIEAKKAEAQKNEKFASLMADGEQLFTENKFQEALAKYKEAKDLKPLEKDPPLKIVATEKKLKEQKENADKMAQFDGFIAEAETLKTAEKYNEAIKKFEQAKLILPDRPEPKEGIDFCNDKIKELADKAKNEAEQQAKTAEYEKVKKAADGLFANGKFQEAIDEYKKAQNILPEETYPATKIAEAEGKIAELAQAKKLKDDFDLAVKSGDEALKNENYTSAKEFYTQANELIKDQPLVLQKIKDVDKLIEDNKAAVELEKSYQDLMTAGEQLISDEKFTEAKAKFEEAQKLKSKETLPEERIKFIDGKLAELKANQALKEDFEKAKKLAEKKEQDKDIPGAIAAYEAAYALIAEESLQTKIQQLKDDQLNQAAAAERAQKFNDAMAEAEKLLTAKNWNEAILKLNEAKTIDPAQKTPDEKIKLAQDELDKLEAAKNRKVSFQQNFDLGVENMNNKAFKEAQDFFKKALEFADLPEDKKNAEDKLEEVKKTREKLDAEALKVENFNKAMEAAQAFEVNEKYKEALDEYAKALTIDPSAELPKQKQKELNDKLAEIQKLEAQKKQFEDLLKAGNDLFLGGKFEESISKFNEAKQVDPSSEIPQQKIDEVNKKIQEIANDKEAQAYKAIMDEAANLRTDGKLEEAIKRYKDALNKRPQDPTPTEKIKEIENEIQEKIRLEAELKEKRAQFEKLSNQGKGAFQNKEYQKALDFYNEASKLLPDEAAEINNKIEQINDIMATLEQERLAAEQKQNNLKNLMLKGDNFFKNQAFEDALNSFEEARDIDSTYTDVLTKIDITKERIAFVEKQKKEKAITDKLAEADEAFKARKYDDAKDLYNELLTLKENHPRALSQIELIERITSPSNIVPELEDLGKPSSYSIMEGEALLMQAAKDREYKKLKVLRELITEIEAKKLELAAMSNEELLEAYRKANKIKKGVSDAKPDENLQQWLLDQYIQEQFSEMSETQLLENIIAYKALMSTQGAVTALLQGVDQPENPNLPYMNEEALQAYMKTFLENKQGANTDAIEKLLENYASIQKLKNLNEHEAEISALIIQFNRLLVQTLMNNPADLSPEEMERRWEYLNTAVNALNSYAADMQQRADQNREAIGNTDAHLKSAAEQAQSSHRDEISLSYQTRQELIDQLQELNQLMREQNDNAKLQNDAFNDEVRTLQAKYAKAYSENITANYLKLHINDQSIQKLLKNSKVDIDELIAQLATKYLEVQEINRLVLIENERIAESQKRAAYNNNLDINAMAKERAVNNYENHDLQLNSADQAAQISKDANQSNMSNLERAKQSSLENQAYLTELGRKGTVINEQAANKLGELFPEGVTEENFIIKNEEDQVVEVRTRRIVVVNGHGAIYMRYSNGYGQTYTKNNEPITKHQWTKETQHAKLEKHIIE